MEIIYSLVQIDRADEISEFLMDNFFPNEPISIASGLTRDQLERWFPSSIIESIKQNASVLATDAKSGKIVGVAINIFGETNVNETEGDEGRGLLDIINPELEPSMVKIANFLGILNKVPKQVYKSGADANGKVRRMNCVYLSVLKSYARKGIGKTLVEKSELIASDSKVAYMQVDTTSEFSYKIFHKHCGFPVVCELPLVEHFENLDQIENGVHKYGRILLKRISAT